MSRGARLWYSGGTGIAVSPLAFAFFWRGNAPATATEWLSLGLCLFSAVLPVAGLAYAASSGIKWVRWTAYLLFASILISAVVAPFLLAYLVLSGAIDPGAPDFPP